MGYATDSKVLEEIAQLIGFEATKRLVEVAGGQSRTIPETAREEHWLTMVVGWEAAKKLCARYGGAQALSIPRDLAQILRTRNRVILADRQSGMTIMGIAAKHGLTDRQIYNILGSLDE